MPGHRSFVLVSLSVVGGVVGLFLCFAGCSGDDPVSPRPSSTLLVEGAIDGAGGELVHEDAVLVVPPGALAGETDLAVYRDSDDHPFGETAVPVYRITGLPAEIGAPLVFRFKHGVSPDKGETLLTFLGEYSDSFDAGEGLNWERITARDSLDWCITDLDHGASGAGLRERDGDLRVAAASDLEILSLEGGHFRIVFRPDQISREWAVNALQTFESGYESFALMGFETATNDTVWPLDIHLRKPPGIIACYLAAPFGKGTFVLDPDLGGLGSVPIPIVHHELFHAVQTFYDPRAPSQWGALNQERLWLDEATAAWLEADAVDSDEYNPMGMTLENYGALLAGIAGHPSLSASGYGYGMSSFIKYFMDEVNSGGEEILAALYEKFAECGDVTEAIDAVISPPVSSWCVGMQREFMATGIFPYDDVGAYWLWWPEDGTVPVEPGGLSVTEHDVPDLGAGVARFIMDETPPADLTALEVEARQAAAGAGPEALPIAVYGRRSNHQPVFIASGVDSLRIDDWPGIHGEFQELLVLVSRPFSTSEGHTGSRRISIELRAVVDISAVDITTFDSISIEVRTNNTYSNMGYLQNQPVHINFYHELGWTGNGFYADADLDTCIISVDSKTLAMGDWYASRDYRALGQEHFVRQLGGYGLPLDSWGEDFVFYVVYGEAVCDFLTRVYETRAFDVGQDPYQVLLDFSCMDGDFVWSGSEVSIQLYRYPARDRN